MAMPCHQEEQVSLYYKHTWPTTQTDSSEQLSFWEDAATLRSFNLADSLWNAVQQKRWTFLYWQNVSNASNARALYAMFHHVSCSVSVQHLWDTSDHQGSDWSVHFWQLSNSRHSATQHFATDQQNEAKAEVEIVAQGIFSKDSATSAVSRYTGHFVSWEFI